nr:MAG TPA: Protein of unknown function (DUF1666) [Ackermannviridae sp.]
MISKKLPPLWKQQLVWCLCKLLNINFRIYPNRPKDEKVD